MYAQQHDKKMEENLNTLNNLLYAGAKTLGMSFEQIAQTNTYITTYTDLHT